jgi:hypothetical protein
VTPAGGTNVVDPGVVNTISPTGTFAHEPATQPVPLGQVFPHAPQLFESLARSTHDAPHVVIGGLHGPIASGGGPPSGGTPVHMFVVHAQPAHEPCTLPIVGPDDVPGMQRFNVGHQPHTTVLVQLAQSVFRAQY